MHPISQYILKKTNYLYTCFLFMALQGYVDPWLKAQILKQKASPACLDETQSPMI